MAERTKLNRAAKATRSGLRRYPRALWQSLVQGRAGAGGPWRAPESCPSGLCRFDTQELAATWIGHATVLLRVGGRTVLTDPVFSHRIGMRVGGVTFGLSRLMAPGIHLQHLPKIDAIVLSHAHFDHLDRPSLEVLARLHPEATVITARNTSALIPRGFSNVIEADWDREIEVGGLRVHAIRPAHWGARAAIDRHRGFNAYLLERHGRRVLFAGDTAHTRAFDRVGRHDLSIFGIGAYEPWEQAHANPEQAWDMFEGAGGERFLPMHHSTFDLGEEGIDEPMERLREVAGREMSRVVCREPGVVWEGE